MSGSRTFELNSSYTDFENNTAHSAWIRWEKYSCVERHGGHLWLAELFCPEDGSLVDVSCEYCPATLDDLYPDPTDLIYGELGSIHIEAGHHDCDFPILPFSLPVSASVRTEKYFNPLDMIYPEYDVFIDLSLRS